MFLGLFEVKFMSDDSKNILKHESPIRKMQSDANGKKYTALKNLEEARQAGNAYLIMEGDDGGQIYLVAPVAIVKTTEDTLNDLLKDLDSKAWDDISMAGLYYETHEPNTAVSGGMGGGMAENSLWVHKDFEGFKDKIQKVIEGLSNSIAD